jgi:hypothetical protein
MSRGLGRIERECLRFIEFFEGRSFEPSTIHIAAKVYHVKDRTISGAQYVATKRALASLQRKGLVTGLQHFAEAPDGRRYLYRQDVFGRRAERCCIWSLVRGEGQAAPTFNPPQKSDAAVAFEIGVSRSTVRRARAAQRTEADRNP